MQGLLPYVAGFVLLALCLRYGGAVWRVLSLRLRAERGHERVAAEAVPPELRALLDGHGRALEASGFEPLAWMREAYLIDGVDDATWTRLYRHAEPAAYALLTVSGQPSRMHACDVLFLSLSEDGRKLATVAFGFLQDWVGLRKHTVVDARSVDYTEQWQRHQSELAAQEEFAARDISGDELVAECADSARRALEHMVGRGAWVRCADGRLRFGLRAALELVVRSTRLDADRRKALAALERKRKAELGSAAAAAAPEPSVDEVAAEVFAHRRREGAEQSRQTGWLKKLALFCGSVVLFALAFGLHLSATTLALLFGVLLLHELGHALAMKLFGYRDLQVLFIPFLGAVASGRKRDTKPHEEIVVLLAGPVPGIALGSAIFAAGWGSGSGWPADAATLLLIVNYLNLLPIMPLDGGRIMNLVLFDRFPLLQLVFSGLSGLAVLAAGVHTDDRILYAFGLFLLLALPTQWRQNQLLAAVRARLATPGPALQPRDPLPAIYAELRRPRFDAWNAETRYQFVTQLLTRLTRPVAGPGLAFLSVAGWLLVMALPLGVIAYRPYSEIRAARAEAEGAYARELGTWNAKLAAAKSPADQARAHLGAGELALERARFADAASHFEAAAALLRPLDERALAATVELRLGQLAPAWPENAPEDEWRARALRHFERALDLRETAFGPESLEVAEVLESFPAERAAPHAGGAAALVRALRLISIYERAKPADAAHAANLVHAYETASLLRADSGDAERAEAALRRALGAADAASEAERAYLHGSAVAALFAFYLERERFDAARALEPADAERCWLAYWQGDPGGARDCFAALPAASPADAAALPDLLDLALATQRAGDAAGAKKLLADARPRIEARADGSFADAVGAWLDAGPDPGFAFGWAAREQHRRSVERARVLAPLLAAL